MAELPYQTYARILGKTWPGGASAEVVGYLKQLNITAAPGSSQANLALQSALLSGWRPGQAAAAPAPTSAAEVQPFLTATQTQLAQETALPKVRTEEEIAAGLAAQGVQTLPTGERPPVPSMVETYKGLREEQGVELLEAQVRDLKAQELQIAATLRQRAAAERGKPVAMGVIEGRISEVERQERENLDFVQRQKAYLVDELNQKYNTISVLMNLMQTDYTNAVNEYNQRFSQNLQVINLIRDIRQEEKDDVQKAKDNARANLQVYWNAITEGGLVINNLPADQKLEIAKMEVAAGLPVGFFAGIRIPDKLLATIDLNNGQTQLLFRKQDGSTYTQTYGVPTPKAATPAKFVVDSAKISTGINVLNQADVLKNPKHDKYISMDEYGWAYQQLIKTYDNAEYARQVLDAAFDAGGFKEYKWS